MKNTKKITLCSLIAALSVVVMLGSYFPYLTYAVPAISGLFMMVPLIECGILWSVATYITSAVIIAFAGEIEASILYIMILGYYPILKALIERINKQVIEWPLKLLSFNTAIVSFYYIYTVVFAQPFESFGNIGKYGLLAFWALCNVVFVIYDIGISRMASFYMFKLHDKIKKIMK